MVQVDPLVVVQVLLEYLVVPDRLVLDAGVVEHHRDGVVPGRRVRRRVDSDLGRALERHGLHVGVCDRRTNPRLTRRVNWDDGNAAQCRLSAYVRAVRK